MKEENQDSIFWIKSKNLIKDNKGSQELDYEVINEDNNSENKVVSKYLDSELDSKDDVFSCNKSSNK